MSRVHLTAVGAVALCLLGGIGLFQACMGPAGGDGDSLLVGDEVLDPGADDMVVPPEIELDAGAPGLAGSMEVPAEGSSQLPPPRGAPTPCAGTTCAPGEICCPVDGTCVPADCADCCPVADSYEGAPAIPLPDVAPGPAGPGPRPGEGPFTPPGPGPMPGESAPGAAGPTPPPPSPE